MVDSAADLVHAEYERIATSAMLTQAGGDSVPRPDEDGA
jgi:hypothetical protein